MTTTALLSELDAVNIALGCVGQPAVSSLTSSGNAAVADAKRVLDEVSREVQELGWGFNTEQDYPLLRAVDGTITAPANTLKLFETQPSTTVNQPVLRGLRVYDKLNHTYVWTKDLRVTITLLLDWADLPQAARSYIAIRAARRFQTRTFGSDTKHKFSEGDEYMAKAALEAAEGETERHNMVTDSYSCYAVIER